MVFTKDQKNDIKLIICQCFQDQSFMDSLSGKLSELVSLKLAEEFSEMEKKLDKLNTRITQVVDENQKIRVELDQMYQDRKTANLRIYGIKESKNENVPELVKKIFTDKLSLELDDFKMISCYRIKTNHDNTRKTRPVIVRFATSEDCRKVISRKKNLKGSNITIAEDLTKYRYEIFVNAREYFGKRNVWSQSGKICILSNGKKHYIKSDTELRQIQSLPL